MTIKINLGDITLTFGENEVKDYIRNKGYELKDLSKHNGLYESVKTYVLLENTDEYFVNFFKRIAIEELENKLKSSLLKF